MATLKRWAVRQISGLLSEYLEGITEQNLQASLSLEVGEVEIGHVRLHPGLFGEKHLHLLGSDVSVSARIPWRNLGSEPTVIIFRDVWAEVQADHASEIDADEEKAAEHLHRWRARRRRQVESRIDSMREIIAAAAAETSSEDAPRRGVAARLGHAALRQLQVRVEGLRARVHPADSSAPPLELSIVRLALDEGGGSTGEGVTEVPAEVRRHPASLDKVLELVGLCAHLSGSGLVEQATRPDWPELRKRLEDLQRSLECDRNAGTLATRQHELSEIKAELVKSVGTPTPLLGPLSLDARLWHSKAGGLLWLHTELQVAPSTAAISVSPSAVKYLCEGLNWYSLAHLAPPPGVCKKYAAGGEGVEGGEGLLALRGSEYVELCARRMKSEQKEEDELLLEDIEDRAPIEWLARWQLKCKERFGGEAIGTLPPERGGARRVLGWLQRRWKPDSAEGPQSANIGEGHRSSSSSTSSPGLIVSEGSDDGVEVEAIDELVKEAGRDSFFEEVEEPRRVEVRIVIPHCTILTCRPDLGGVGQIARTLRLEGGVECLAAVTTARAGTMAAFLKAAWDADVRANLSSIAVLLDAEPLLLLQQSSGSNADRQDGQPAFVNSRMDGSPLRSNSFEGEDEFFDVDSDPEDLIIVPARRAFLSEHAAVCLSVLCARFGGAAAGAGDSSALPWSVRARLKQEPFRFTLGPHSTHDALEIMVAMARAVASTRSPESRRVDTFCWPSGLADGSPSAEDSETATTSPTAGHSPETIALDLDLDVAAPVLRWALLPRGHVTIAFGRLLFRTSGQLPPPAHVSSAESCNFGTFACHCQLTETSVSAQGDEGAEFSVYDPSTMCLRAWREGESSGWQLSVESEAVRWSVNPTILKVAGQLPMSMDHAISPLRGVFAELQSSPSQAVPIGEDAAAASSTGFSSPRPRPSVPSASTLQTQVGEPPHAPPANGGPRFVVKVSIRQTQLVLSPAGGPNKTTLLLEGISAEHAAHHDHSDTMGKVVVCELSCDGIPLVSLTQGASVKIRNADRHLYVGGGSTLIAVQWYEERVRGAIASVEEAWECLVAGHERSQGLFPVGNSAGMFAQIWGRYVIRPIQVRVKEKAAMRLAELLPGFEQGSPSKVPASPGLDSSFEEDSVLADLAESTEQEDARTGDHLPNPRGECSVEVSLCYEGLSLVFPGPEDLDPVTAPVLQVAVTGAEIGFRAFRSGDAAGFVSLLSMTLDLSGRRLLAPRRGDKLLRVDVLRQSGELRPQISWTASWAQICILYRQRDYDFVTAFVRKAIGGALPSRLKDESSSAELRPDGSRAERSASPEASPRESNNKGSESEPPKPPEPGARFRLDVGAPLVFLPTDGSCLSPPRLPQFSAAGSGVFQKAVAGGQLEVDTESGEPVFKPLPGEGFLVFDFGHVAATGGGSAAALGEIQLQLRGAQVLGASPGRGTTPEDGISFETPPVRDILLPVSLQAVLSTGDGPLEFHATSLDVADGCGPVDHRLSLTRAQLTLIFDVIAENICYSGRSGSLAAASVADSGTQLSSATRPSADVRVGDAAGGERKVKSRGFRCSWTWPGELAWDLAFTEAVPLGRLRLRAGRFSFSSLSEGSSYELKCSALTVMDSRTKSKNVVKTLLECAECPEGKPGFLFRVDVPVEEDTIGVVQLQRPAMHVLPQLVMDLITAGLSAWQHCTFRNDRAQIVALTSAVAEQSKSSSNSRGPSGGGSSSSAATTRGTRWQVNFLDGHFRIAEKWAEPTEHFEFAGSVLIHILVHAEGISIERLDLEGGALRLRSARRGLTTLCPCLEWILRGEQRRVDDQLRMKRHTSYDLRSVIVPPYAIRMSARDHQAMANSFLELLSMDAESAEPASETQSRDPLALQLVENRLTLVAEVAIQGAEFQVMGEEGGHEWPGLRAHARCPLLQVTVESRQGSAPTINLYGRELEVDLWSHNYRLGAWEPVLPSCGWKFSYHTQRKPDGGPRDVVIRADVSAIKPVRLVISAPFVHLASRIFKASSGDLQYGDLLSGANISGVTCRVSVDGGAESQLLASNSSTQPLDGLLKGSGRLGPSTQPCLELRLVDFPDVKPCLIPLGREISIAWETQAVGLLICRLVMPRPPKTLLLISSSVCVWNKTPADLEVRFLAPSFEGENEQRGLKPVFPPAACRCIDARWLHAGMGWDDPQAGSGAAEQQLVGGSKTSSSSSSSSGGDVLRIGAGELLSAPAEAQLRMGQAVLQLRPQEAACGGVAYEWSDPFFSVPGGMANEGITVCSTPPAAMQEVLPKHWLHARTAAMCTPQDGWSTVEVEAPFTIVNACPCDVLCRLNPPVKRVKLGREKDSLPVEPGPNIELVVYDGRGGEVNVPCNGQAEVLPLRLDEDGYFKWSCNGKPGQTKPRWRNVNCLFVVVNGRSAEVEWHCIQAVMGSDAGVVSPIRMGPQSLLPVFDAVADDLTVSFALRDAKGNTTSWSLPLQAVTTTRLTEELIELECKGMWVKLNAFRKGRELVVYARRWFANSTGLDVWLLRPWGTGPMHPVPCFGQNIFFLPELRNEAGESVAHVGLRGHAPVEVRVPDVGSAEPVQLTVLHPCCLRTETVALQDLMRGAPSSLVSLLPAIMLFNHAEEHVEVGFRQLGCPSETAVWVPPGASRALWWSSTSEQGIQVAARHYVPVGMPPAPGETRTQWSHPFELGESKIGAYPVTLKHSSQSSRLLLCVCIDQDGATMAITIRGNNLCHAIANKHPSILLQASLEGVGDDPAYHFAVASGVTLHCAGRGPPVGVPRLRLCVQSDQNHEERAVVMVDLHRSGMHKVPVWTAQSAGGAAASLGSKKRKSTLRVPAVVSVVLQNRVAVVTVTPGLPTSTSPTPPSLPFNSTSPSTPSLPLSRHAEDGEEASEENLKTFTGELRLDHLAIALLVEGPGSRAGGSTAGAAGGSAQDGSRHEAFTVNLAGVQVQVSQTPDRCREVDFKITDMQLDMQYPKRDVVLKNTTQPFLRTHSKRDDVRILDAHMQRVQLEFGDLEVSITGAFMDQARQLRRNLILGPGGLTFEQVLTRARGAFYLSNPQPPPASGKFVVRKLVVGDVKIDVWCRLYLPDAHYLPQSLRDTIQVVSLGTTRLDIKGAQMKLPQQALFSERAPAEGNLGVVFMKVSDHYLPHVKACWRSVLQHSNIFLGGLLSRHAWAPRIRRSWTPGPPICEIEISGSGVQELRLRES
ncbi:unnamed protein product [Polarella glacialis]|uniref:Calmodulin n=1 Tax=Polarella glacialis TaxID=89957 RepID=A0A813HJT4_POLGL|nr:unnamed protein product [Polarella glacialis]